MMRRWGKRLFLGLVVIVFTLPVIWTLLASLGIHHDNTTSPSTWTLSPSLENYFQIRIEQTFFWQELATSVQLSAATTLTVVTVAFLAAYSLARSRFPGRNLLVNGFLILASLPVISYLIPLEDTMRHLQLHDTFAGVVLAETALFAPLAAYVIYGYINQMPAELEDTARLDGATLRQLLLQVVLPVTAPGVTATAVIIFVLSWNQFFVPLALTSTQIKTIPVMVRDFFVLDRDFEWPKVAAVLVVSLLPVGAFVAAANRALERFSLSVVTEMAAEKD